MREKMKLFSLIGQMAMMAVAVVVGGPAAMAVTTGAVDVTNIPEAEVTNPIETQATTADGGPAAFPEQSVTTGEQAAPVIYEPQYDKELVKIRPTHTPIDTIGRNVNRKSVRTKGMEYQYGQISYLDNTTTLSGAFTEPTSSNVGNVDSPVATLSVNNAGIFNRRDLIIVDGVSGYDEAGTSTTDQHLMLWVSNRIGNTQIEVIAVNGKKVGSIKNVVPGLSSGQKLMRIAKACAELDSQAPGYAIFPKTGGNYNQKFMAQVEQSNIDAATAKRFDINLSQQEEATLATMRMDMEGAFLFSVKSKFTDPDSQRNVWTTEGIWWQAKGGDITYYPSTEHPFTLDSIIDLSRMVFTGPSAGKSDRRMVVCGSKLLAVFEKAFAFANYHVNKESKWDLTFSSVRTNFGEFWFILDEAFDKFGRAGCGMIIDIDYLERRYLEPFGRTTLDLDKQGVRDSKAIVLREISSMILKAPKNHYRIMPDDNISAGTDGEYAVYYQAGGNSSVIGEATKA